MNESSNPVKSSKRRGRRYPVDNVQGTLHFNTEARILNVSLTGVALESALPVRVGRSYSITLRHDDEQKVHLSATVAWCHLQETRKNQFGESTPIYAAGLSFNDTLTEKASHLIRFLERSAIITVGQRVTGRFRVSNKQLISLNTEYEFVVKNVSLRGLQLETDLSPEIGAVFEIEVVLPACTLQVRARVARVKEIRLADKRVIAEVEMEYADLAPDDRTHLSKFIASELQPPENPSTTRTG
ncbi:MAG: PilZ domain-containing protein [Thermoanaerobaculaceae bacterium]